MPLAARSLPLLACGLLTVLLLQAGLLQGQTLVGGDLLSYSYPRYGLLGEALAQGQIPRWNPWVYHGASWFGPRAGGVLYPGNALFAVLPLGRAMAAFVALHLLIGLTGARLLARLAGLGPRAAWAAGLCFGLGGFLTSMQGVLPFLVSGAWLPWAVAGGLVSGRRPWLGTAGLGCAIALILSAVEPQGALAAALAGVLAAGLVQPQDRLTGLLRAGLGVGLGGLAAGLQVVSILTELPDLDRSLEGFQDERWRLCWGLLPELFVGGALGDRAPSLSEAYWGFALWEGRTPWCGASVGAVGLSLAGAGALASTPARRLGLLLTALGVALAASGAGQGLALRFPAKWLVLTALGVALLAGAGAHAILRGDPLAKRTALTIAGVLAAAGLLGWLAAGGASVPAWLESWDDAGRVHGDLARTALVTALARVCLAAAVLVALLRSRLRARVLGALLLGLLAGELTHLAASSFRTLPAEALDRPALVDVVLAASQGPGPPRLDSNEAVRTGEASPRPGLTAGGAAQQACVELLIPDVGIRHGVRSVLAFDTVRPAELDRLRLHPALGALDLAQRAALIDAEMFVVPADGFSALPAAERARFQVVGRYELFRPQRLVIRSRSHPDWAYLAAEVQPAGSLEQARDQTLDPSRDPRRTVVLGPEGAPVELTSSSEGSVALEAFEPETIRLRVRTPSPAWLVVRDAYSRDWQATVDDGGAGPLTRADVLFRAVHVPAGEHTITLRYAPRWWWPGLLCSLLGLLALGVTGWIGLRQGKR